MHEENEATGLGLDLGLWPEDRERDTDRHMSSAWDVQL